MAEFLKFLACHKTKKERNNITHLCLFPDNAKGCYHIPTDELSRFNDLFANVVSKNARIGILEKHQDLNSYRLFFDIDLSSPDTGRLYTFDEIYNFLVKATEIFCKFFAVSSEHIKCYVAERKAPILPSNNIQKDGLHLYFNLYVTHKLHEVLHHELLGIMSEFQYFKDPNDLDPSVICHNGLLLCGACKPDKDAYHISHIFEFDINNQKYLLSPFKVNIRTQLELSIIRSSEELTPLKPSIDQYLESLTEEQTLKQRRKSRSQNLEYDDVCKYSAVHIRYAKYFAMLLSKKRLSNYPTWLETACTLYNISPGLFTVFDDISKKTTRNNYDSDVTYATFFATNPDHDNKRGLGSLIKDAKTDQPNRANTLIKKMVRDLEDEKKRADAFQQLENNFSDELNHALRLSKEFQWVTDDYNEVCQTTLKDPFDVIAHLRGFQQEESVTEYYSSVSMQNNRLHCTNKDGVQMPLRSHDLKEIAEKFKEVYLAIHEQENKDTDQAVNYINSLENISEYRKLNGHIYVRHPIALNYFVKYAPISEFLSEKVQDAPETIKNSFATRQKTRQEMASSIEDVHFFYRPLKISRYIIAFRNGFLNFENIEEDIKFCFYQDVVDYEDSAKIFFDIDFDIDILSVDSWEDIDCPGFSKLVDHNFGLDEQNVREVFYGLCGRLHFPPSSDKKQVVPYVIGPAGVGKSTIMDIILSQHAPTKTTVVNTKEKAFGGQNLIDKHLLVDVDASETMIDNFCGENGKTTFQKIVDGGSNVCLPIKRGVQFEGDIEIQQFYCANYEQKVDEGGEIARRLAMFEFKKPKGQRDDNLGSNILKYESAALLVKMLLAYRSLLQKYKGQIFDDWNVPFFKAQKERRLEEYDPLRRYFQLTDHYELTRDHKDTVKWSDFVRDYEKTMGRKHLSQGDIRYLNNDLKISTEVLCKSCRKKHLSGCCDSYATTNRTSCKVIKGLRLI